MLRTLLFYTTFIYAQNNDVFVSDKDALLRKSGVKKDQVEKFVTKKYSGKKEEQARAVNGLFQHDLKDLEAKKRTMYCKNTTTGAFVQLHDGQIWGRQRKSNTLADPAVLNVLNNPENPKLSRIQFTITFNKGRWYLTDSSQNGTQLTYPKSKLASEKVFKAKKGKVTEIKRGSTIKFAGEEFHCTPNNKLHKKVTASIEKKEKSPSKKVSVPKLLGTYHKLTLSLDTDAPDKDCLEEGDLSKLYAGIDGIEESSIVKEELKKEEGPKEEEALVPVRPNPTKLKGLNNGGNNCYILSAIQLFFMNHKLEDIRTTDELPNLSKLEIEKKELDEGREGLIAIMDYLNMEDDSSQIDPKHVTALRKLNVHDRKKENGRFVDDQCQKDSREMYAFLKNTFLKKGSAFPFPKKQVFTEGDHEVGSSIVLEEDGHIHLTNFGEEDTRTFHEKAKAALFDDGQEEGVFISVEEGKQPERLSVKDVIFKGVQPHDDLESRKSLEREKLIFEYLLELMDTRKIPDEGHTKSVKIDNPDVENGKEEIKLAFKDITIKEIIDLLNKRKDEITLEAKPLRIFDAVLEWFKKKPYGNKTLKEALEDDTIVDAKDMIIGRLTTLKDKLFESQSSKYKIKETNVKRVTPLVEGNLPETLEFKNDKLDGFDVPLEFTLEKIGFTIQKGYQEVRKTKYILVDKIKKSGNENGGHYWFSTRRRKSGDKWVLQKEWTDVNDDKVQRESDTPYSNSYLVYLREDLIINAD